MIAFSDYRKLYESAKDHEEVDTYITTFEGDHDKALLETIYSFVHEGIVGRMRAEHMLLTKLADKYGLPYRTVQNWRDGTRKSPDHVMLLLGYAVIAETCFTEKEKQETS